MECKVILSILIFVLNERGDAFEVIEPHSLRSLPVKDAEDLLQILPLHAEPELLVEALEVLEAESSNLVFIVLVEDPLDWSTFPLEAVVELRDPVLQDHPLEAPLCLELSRAVYYCLFEVSGRDRKILAFVVECTAHSIDLVLGQACLQLLQALLKFPLSQPALCGLGLLVPPLVE